MSRQRKQAPIKVATPPTFLWGGYYVAIAVGGGVVVEPATVIAIDQNTAINKLICFSKCKFEAPDYYGHNAEVMPITAPQIVQAQRLGGAVA